MAGVGVAIGAGTKPGVTIKLPQLQNLCKRDPDGYREDYDAQARRLESECGILALSPSSDPSPRIVELIQFAAAVSSSSYKGKESDRISNILIDLLLGSSSSEQNQRQNSSKRGPVSMTMSTAALQLHRDVRKSCVSALILMRNKGAIKPLKLLELFFRIMSVVPDKGLREQLYKHIVNDVRNINKKGKRDEQVNRSVQSFLHRVVSLETDQNADEETATEIAAKRATDMVCELYRRGVWTDDRTVAILASAVTSRNTTVMCRAIRFFLNIEEKMADDAKKMDHDDWQNISNINLHQHSKKTKANMRHVMKQLKNRKKAQQKRETGEWMETEDKGVEAAKKLFPAIEMLRDPQGLAEAVFKRIRSASSHKYEVKLLMINFVTRLVGNHELLLLPLYPFLQKYMGGHQRDVTAVLAYSVQACHEYVPPDEVYGILKTISHNFITERCSGEQMAVGINAARAICARVPAALSVEESQESSGSTVMDIEAFTRDLAAYSNHRDRSASIAGKAWTNFIRETNPGLLQGKDRGLAGSALHRSGEKPMRYGQQNVASGVDGADLLVEYEAKKAASRKKKAKGSEDTDDDDDEGDGIEEVPMNDEEEQSDDSGGWRDAKSDGNAAGEGGRDGSANEMNEVDSDDEEAPDLVLLNSDDDDENDESEKNVLDVSKMTREERDKLKQHVSATRIFSAADFERMRKLVEREQRAKRDPREAARRKRAIAQGKEFEELSDDESDSEQVRITGAVNPEDIMAEAKRKRMSKAERLESILAGRQKFEAKGRDGGATNTEKKRTKNFMMSKYSRDARTKRKGEKSTSSRKRKPMDGSRDAKKRRRKL